MNRYILFIALMICVLLAMCQKAAFGDVPANEQDAAVTMTITKLQVNDQTLELSWKIVNRSDHDVWILDKFHLFEPSIEVYLAEDNQTLLIRRRLDVPAFGVWFATPEGRYVRMRPGEERLESLSLDIPISASWLFAGGQWSALSSAVIKSIKLEIGYYDEDLPRLIRGILAEAEKHSPTISDDSHVVLADYFPGLLVYFACGGLSDFEASYKNESDDIWVPYTYQALKSEQVLRATVDGVAIPYGEVQAADEPPQSETELAGVTMALTRMELLSSTLELRWTIKNGSEHDVWICDHVIAGTQYPEVYLAEDKQTIMIRKRLDVPKPTHILWTLPPIGRYVRLRPGEERSESLSITLPVIYETVFASTEEIQGIVYAKRLVLEIGFYNEDLPGLIRRIIEAAERLGCARLEPNDRSSDIIRHYYKGLLIKNLFGGLSHFDERHSGSSGYFSTTCTEQLLGEQSLRIIVDGVYIPYGTQTSDEQSRQTGSSEPDKPGHEKG